MAMLLAGSSTLQAILCSSSIESRRCDSTPVRRIKVLPSVCQTVLKLHANREERVLTHQRNAVKGRGSVASGQQQKWKIVAPQSSHSAPYM